MSGFERPCIFASKCLGFDACRWNGEMLSDGFVDRLKPHVKFITHCPECDVGLGVPRDPIRITKEGDEYRLRQFNSARDLTEEMEKSSESFLSSIEDVDGFILKDRSPSCGLKDVKVYRDLSPGGPIGKTNGFFAKEVLNRFSYLPVETEMRLTNFNLRENFLTKIFVFAAFRKVKKCGTMKALVEFHSSNKLLFMSYNQSELRQMGPVVANHEKKNIDILFKEYEDHLNRALAGHMKYTSNINVMTHAFGYFSGELSSEEKRFFLNTLEEYRREQVPLSVPVSILRSYIVRFKEEYLSAQTFFKPYPLDFVSVRDSGKGNR